MLAASALVGTAFVGPAFATSSSCGSDPAAVDVAPTVCEITLTSSGTFTPNSQMIKVEALLVGAGGSSVTGYAGGGGEVTIIELDNSGDATVTVGAGGTYLSGGDGTGGTTSVTQGVTTTSALGGTGFIPYHGGNSGNGNVASGWGGAGAGAASGDNINGGPGMEVSSLTSTLFSTDTDCFGGGGAGFYTYQGDTLTQTVATCGGGYLTNFVGNTYDGGSSFFPNTGSASVHLPVANSGGGGGIGVSFGDASQYTSSDQDGADGVVKIRWSHELPETGARQFNLLSLLGVSVATTMLLAGSAMLAAARRRRA